MERQEILHAQMSEILAPQEDASLFALTDAASETPKAET